MSEELSRVCKCCSIEYRTSNSELLYCSTLCVETAFRIQQEELLEAKRLQLIALSGLNHACVVCGSSIQTMTQRKTVKHYCSSKCSLQAISRHKKVTKPCAHCDAPVQVLPNMRPEFVRCATHRNLWPKVRSESAKNMKKTKVAEAPFDQYLLRGPWWDHKKKHWSVLLLHSGASSKREMEYARYLLSVKTGHKVGDSEPVTYVDGDRTNVEISNLALG